MEAKPNLSTSTKRVVVALWGGEEGSSDRRVPDEDREVHKRVTQRLVEHENKTLPGILVVFPVWFTGCGITQVLPDL